MATNKTSDAGKVVAGVGLAALAAAAAATYYFSGSEGKKHQKQAMGFGKKAKAEMLKKIKQMRQVSKTAYEQAANEVVAKYKQVKNIDPAELAALGKELKGHWDGISKSLNKMGGKAMKAMPKKATSKVKAKKK